MLILVLLTPWQACWDGDAVTMEAQDAAGDMLWRERESWDAETDPLLTANDSNREHYKWRWQNQVSTDNNCIARLTWQYKGTDTKRNCHWIVTRQSSQLLVDRKSCWLLDLRHRVSPRNYILSKGLRFPFAQLQSRISCSWCNRPACCRWKCESCKINFPLHGCWCRTASVHCTHWAVQPVLIMPSLHRPPSINHDHCSAVQLLVWNPF